MAACSLNFTASSWTAAPKTCSGPAYRFNAPTVRPSTFNGSDKELRTPSSSERRVYDGHSDRWSAIRSTTSVSPERSTSRQGPRSSSYCAASSGNENGPSNAAVCAPSSERRVMPTLSHPSTVARAIEAIRSKV
jgi:hypothetical protein